MDIGAAIIDPDLHDSTVAEVGHADNGAKWQRAVRRGQPVPREQLTARCRMPDDASAVVCGDAGLSEDGTLSVTRRYRCGFLTQSWKRKRAHQRERQEQQT